MRLPKRVRPLSKPGFVVLPIIVVSWFIYAWLIPLVMVTWKVTGDEPHYLLAAYSLTHDGDLDLKNNYLHRDYAAFYAADYLDPHVKQQPNGAWLLVHDIGLPILIAPAFALAGRLGVMQFMAVVGALLAGQTFLLAWEVSGKFWAGLLAWLGLAFAAPLSLYVFQIYPELVGSLFVLFAARAVVDTSAWLPQTTTSPYWQRGRWVAVSLALAALPWLSGRFLPLLFLLLAILIYKHRANPKRFVSVASLALISTSAYLAVNFYFYGGPTPSNTVAGNAVSAGFSNIGSDQIWRGLAGWWLDQQRGLLVYGPVWLLAFIGLPHLWQLRRGDGLLLIAPLGLIWLLASVWGGFYIGWEISARFLIVGLPLLAAAVAAGLARIRSVLFWPLAAVLCLLSLFNTAIVVLNPFYAFHESPVTFYEQASGWSLRPYLPALGTRAMLVSNNGSRIWSAPVGQAGYLTQATLGDLGLGWYVVRGQAQFTQSANAGQPPLILDIYSSESGQPLAHADIPADPNQTIQNISIPFYNPYYNHWDFPLYFDLQSTGAAAVRLSPLAIDPDPVPTFGRVFIWIAIISALILAFADKSTVRSALARLVSRESRLQSSKPSPMGGET